MPNEDFKLLLTLKNTDIFIDFYLWICFLTNENLSVGKHSHKLDVLSRINDGDGLKLEHRCKLFILIFFLYLLVIA